jgi:hypothetical protein
VRIRKFVIEFVLFKIFFLIKTNIYKISANARGTLLTTLPNRVQQRS